MPNDHKIKLINAGSSSKTNGSPFKQIKATMINYSNLIKEQSNTNKADQCDVFVSARSSTFRKTYTNSYYKQLAVKKHEMSKDLNNTSEYIKDANLIPIYTNKDNQISSNMFK